MDDNFDEPTLKRFWAKVDKGVACWLWNASRHPFGYGSFRLKDKNIPAHRFSWIVAYGPIPDGFLICHRCDNPPCVNPNHLFMGRDLENAHDKIRKGRGRVPMDTPGFVHWLQENPPVGEKNPRAKLTWELVAEIRARYAAGGIVQEQLAREYGVGLLAISRIVRFATWKLSASAPPNLSPRGAHDESRLSVKPTPDL